MSTTINIHPVHRNNGSPNGNMRVQIQAYHTVQNTVWHTVDIYMSDENDCKRSSLVSFFPDNTSDELDKMFPEAIWMSAVFQ